MTKALFDRLTRWTKASIFLPKPDPWLTSVLQGVGRQNKICAVSSSATAESIPSQFSQRRRQYGYELLFFSENCVLCHFSDPEFENGFGRNPDLLLCLGIKARARFSLLLHQLAKARQNEFAGLFGCFVS